MMHETVARYYRRISRFGLLPRMLMPSIVEILGRMGVRIVVHIAKVDPKLIVTRLLDQRMHNLNPFGFALLHGHRFRPVADGRRPTEELTVPWRRCREYNAGHKPSGWDFTEKYQHNGAQLPATEFAGNSTDNVDLFHNLALAVTVTDAVQKRHGHGCRRSGQAIVTDVRRRRRLPAATAEDGLSAAATIATTSAIVPAAAAAVVIAVAAAAWKSCRIGA